MRTTDPSASTTRGSLLPPTASLDCLSPGDIALLLANARMLDRVEGAVERRTLLRGKNLALICESADEADAIFFQGAASALGAHVSHIRPSLSEPITLDVLQHTARMLGRLYEGVECQGLPSAVVREVGREAGIPVYDGLATGRHPIVRLADLLNGGRSDAKRRELIVQAVLVSTIG